MISSSDKVQYGGSGIYDSKLELYRGPIYRDIQRQVGGKLCSFEMSLDVWYKKILSFSKNILKI